MIYKHKKTGGLYDFLFVAFEEATMNQVVVYRSVKTGDFFTRPFNEFFDGRFEETSEKDVDDWKEWQKEIVERL